MKTKWQRDEIIASYIDNLVRVILFPIIKVSKLHYASVFNTPINRRLQTMAIAILIFLFLAGAQVTMGAVAGIFFLSKYWVYMSIYFTHYFLDQEKPVQGGRPINWFRNGVFWKYARDYFPVMCVKAENCELSPKENYLLAFHPHGVLSLSAICTFGANLDDYRDIFPGMESYLCTLPVWFRVPFFREMLMALGLIPSSRESIRYMLNRPDGGNCVALVVGGAPESLFSRRGNVIELFLQKRFGFIKLALQEGRPVVPVFSFGEHLLFDQDVNPEGSLTKRFQDGVQKYTGGITFPAFHGRGIMQYDIGMMPFRRPIYVVVGEPINFGKISNPNYEEIGKCHSIYIEKLKILFDTYKSKYLSADAKLIIK